ncbi:predicted protein [Sclerotinia sclerotiorum 1980 UF-70]|uniref:Uncharacterized protein n=1 Tax=Sclerotinia sclerotiorum (strain ATCC 18683 / 1980 / Ss-1) TaxID=665079 RepID=A7E9S9_SCLS1|nr:predicted protein [Sclerotinia sclerotiorum 1980 UF-70]EDN97131.1 predicted protein [Sclerotinia sclerotiorum 1980 UF-70]
MLDEYNNRKEQIGKETFEYTTSSSTAQITTISKLLLIAARGFFLLYEIKVWQRDRQLNMMITPRL